MAELYLVEFRGSRKEFFYNSYYHMLDDTEYVIVQAERGEDIGRLTLKVNEKTATRSGPRPRSILRRASDEDLSAFEALKEQEQTYKAEVIQQIDNHRLPMKVADVECQFDGNKMTIFFTADHRVDFRELVKELASRYRTRIELRQIGVRDEARRIGGYGICGLRQCCNTFIKEFSPISTQHAREQDLPLNPAKISGNCGRLLCCLKYETSFYAECRKRFPRVRTDVKTKLGNGSVERVDIFREELVILNEEDGSRFRCKPDDILEQGGVVVRRPDPVPAVPDDMEADEDGNLDAADQPGRSEEPSGPEAPGQPEKPSGHEEPDGFGGSNRPGGPKRSSGPPPQSGE